MTGLLLALIVVFALAIVCWLATLADRGADRRLGRVNEATRLRLEAMRDEEESIWTRPSEMDLPSREAFREALERSGRASSLRDWGEQL